MAYIVQKYDDDEIAGIKIISDGNETERIARLNDDMYLPGSFAYNVI